MTTATIFHPEPSAIPKLAVIAAVHLQSVTDDEFMASVHELRELAKTLGYQVVATFSQKRVGFDPNAYLGAGKREEITDFIRDENSLGRPIEAVLVDHEISPTQSYNLERQVECSVMDRTMVILEIFHRNARSREARAQVEIAQLGYMAPRLREAAKLAGPQGRQRSGVGGRGAGEGHMELDKRKIRDRIAQLRLELIAMEKERQTQRARRLGSKTGPADQKHVSVVLVGYTNAGKSTLMRALTGSTVLVANQLFATLDTTVRALDPPSVPKVLVSDTVGFIKNLPHDLVASFKSTLDEALDASLILHVIDASDPGYARQLAVTNTVLHEIQAHEIPRLLVFNKIDAITDPLARQVIVQEIQSTYPQSLQISAIDKADVARLYSSIVTFFQSTLIEAQLVVPWNKQALRQKIFASCEVVSETALTKGAKFVVRGEQAIIDALIQDALAKS
jgi:GTPase